MIRFNDEENLDFTRFQANICQFFAPSIRIFVTNVVWNVFKYNTKLTLLLPLKSRVLMIIARRKKAHCQNLKFKSHIRVIIRNFVPSEQNAMLEFQVYWLSFTIQWLFFFACVLLFNEPAPTNGRRTEKNVPLHHCNPNSHPRNCFVNKRNGWYPLDTWCNASQTTRYQSQRTEWVRERGK